MAMPEPVTQERLRDYLSNHSNWAQLTDDTFEACVESDYTPRRIELYERGIELHFSPNMRGFWHESDQSVWIYYPQLLLNENGLAVRVNVSIVPADRKTVSPLRLPGEPHIEIRLGDILGEVHGDLPGGLDKYGPPDGS